MCVTLHSSPSYQRIWSSRQARLQSTIIIYIQEPEQAVEAKAEDKKEEEKAEEEKKEEPKPPSPCVLFVDLHCVGCAKKIERSILRMKGTLLVSTITDTII